MSKLTRAGLRAQADTRNEKINLKVREHSLAKTPVLIAVGRRETTESTVSIRRLGEKGQRELKLDEAIRLLQDEARAPRFEQKISD